MQYTVLTLIRGLQKLRYTDPRKFGSLEPLHASASRVTRPKMGQDSTKGRLRVLAPSPWGLVTGHPLPVGTPVWYPDDPKGLVRLSRVYPMWGSRFHITADCLVDSRILPHLTQAKCQGFRMPRRRKLLSSPEEVWIPRKFHSS